MKELVHQYQMHENASIELILACTLIRWLDLYNHCHTERWKDRNNKFLKWRFELKNILSKKDS